MSRTLRIASYLRVSTGRQAETDLSIPDQRKQIEVWAASRGHTIANEFAELGASATDDRRPQFQAMIDRACDNDKPFDAIVVHSFSRFMRDSFAFEFYVRKLAKHDVKLLSITQEVVEDDPAHVMMRKVIALFDEYQSKENAKHVLRAMKENARQGFWNGSRPPFGYMTVEVERRGARIKKRLAIDLAEAEEVRLIFRLFLQGDGRSGPMGVKAIAGWLNARGHGTRRGANWGVGPLHKLLTNPVYMGRMRFNRNDSRAGRIKPQSEHITSEVPGLIDPPIFEHVQNLLKSRNPKVTPPRIVTGPILLTGLAKCATCSGGMTLRTGTSRSGKVYHYYTCSTAARAGKSACKGRSIRMDKLDGLVTSHLIEKLFKPDRLEALLSSLATRRAARCAAEEGRIKDLQDRASEADQRLRRLYSLVEDGITEIDDVLRQRITALKLDRDTAQAALSRAQSISQPPTSIDPARIAAFGQLMRDNLLSSETPFRKAYLRAIIDQVEVDDRQIRIYGRKEVLQQAVLAKEGSQLGVQSFVRKWRTRQDSNL